ncbi:MAG: leucine-rich repeat domain-containing protein, partial [Clostridia bacterium]|nr:leucine-rich repeat domain-containing protein [Clostridia bacterium]
MKRILSVLLGTLFLLMCACGEKPRDALEYYSQKDFVRSGSQDGFDYILYSDHVEITGVEVDQIETELEFPSKISGKPVTVIAGFLFVNNTYLMSVTLPSQLEEIGSNLFEGCSALEDVMIPKTVKVIKSGAFKGTAWYESLSDEFVTVGDEVLIKYNGDDIDVKIPDGVKYISDAFAENSRISTVIIPDTVNGICDYAFYNCSSLTEINIPDHISDIGTGAFENTTWIMATLEDFVTVGNGVLIKYNGTETSISLPLDIKYIAGAFYLNKTVTSVTVPASVLCVRKHSFYGCETLNSVKFQGDETFIEDGTFINCIGLTDVELPKNLEIISDQIFYSCSALESIELPKNVKYIGHTSFYNCAELINVAIPEGTTWIGRGAFFGCVKIKEITIPQSVTGFGDAVFGCCYELEKMELPPALTEIPEGLFSCCVKLTEIKLTNRIKKVGSYAFEACQNIKVYVPNESTEFAQDAFIDSNNAEIVCVKGSK